MCVYCYIVNATPAQEAAYDAAVNSASEAYDAAVKPAREAYDAAKSAAVEMAINTSH